MRSESEAEDEARRARSSLTAIPGVSDVTAELLYQNGFKSAEEEATSDEETLGDIDGIDPERAPTILAAARGHVEQKRVEEQAQAAEAARAAEEAARAAAEEAASAASAQAAEAGTPAVEEEAG